MDRPATRWLLTLGLLGCLSAEAASPVWAIRGAHNTVYLAGSIHLLRAADASLPPGFARAYSGAARLIMEVDLAHLDATEMALSMAEYARLPEGTTLEQRIGAARYRRTSAAAAALGLPEGALDGSAPWLVGLQLTELEYVHLGFDPSRGVEQQLVQRALADHKPTGGLETLGDELGVFAHLSGAEQLRFLDMVLADLDAAESDTQAVLAAWRRGDARQLGTLLAHEYRTFPTLYRALVTERNQRWLPQIEALLRQNEDSLVVVGALHLVDKEGLLEALRHDGFTPQQLD